MSDVIPFPRQPPPPLTDPASIRRREAAQEARAWDEATYKAKVAERRLELAAGQVWAGQSGGNDWYPPIGFHILDIAGWRAKVHVHGPDDVSQMGLDDLAGCTLLFGCELDPQNACIEARADA